MVELATIANVAIATVVRKARRIRFLCDMTRADRGDPLALGYQINAFGVGRDGCIATRPYVERFANLMAIAVDATRGVAAISQSRFGFVGPVSMVRMFEAR